MDKLQALLSKGDPLFWNALKEQSSHAKSFLDWQKLSTLRKRAVQAQLNPPNWPEIRIALIGGITFAPLVDFFAIALAFRGIRARFFNGGFDSAAQEILDSESALYTFAPDVTFYFPSIESMRFSGSLFDSHEQQRAEIRATAGTLLNLCRTAADKSKAPVILANFPPEVGHDPGALRSAVPGFSWSYRRLLNLELGFNKPSGVTVLDVEFLATQFGAAQAHDERSWLESRQPFAPDFLVRLAEESAHLVQAQRQASKKVLVLDLDGTLWGGVIGEDGLEDIELGDTSVRGEAFKRFQREILKLHQRGVLLAVCSKNEEANAKAPFERHPETVLKLKHFSAFRSNWNPKPDNLLSIANELNLGLDSLVFIDDNPAEIEAVKQFTPEVTCLLLGRDPSAYSQTLKDCRLFEPLALTLEDSLRPSQYKALAEAAKAFDGVTDIGAYLESLQMHASVCELTDSNLARAAQLIGKSNQFNLTTIRRTESELKALQADKSHQILTVRLSDRLVDHGMVSVVILRKENRVLEIDTWLMSCRVLKRELERLVLGEIAATARDWGCEEILGRYIATEKNGLVRDLYLSLGFTAVPSNGPGASYRLRISEYVPSPLPITLNRRSNESAGSSEETAVCV